MFIESVSETLAPATKKPKWWVKIRASPIFSSCKLTKNTFSFFLEPVNAFDAIWVTGETPSRFSQPITCISINGHRKHSTRTRASIVDATPAQPLVSGRVGAWVDGGGSMGSYPHCLRCGDCTLSQCRARSELKTNYGRHRNSDLLVPGSLPSSWDWGLLEFNHRITDK